MLGFQSLAQPALTGSKFKRHNLPKPADLTFVLMFF
jgi:hypothetical protein